MIYLYFHSSSIHCLFLICSYYIHHSSFSFLKQFLENHYFSKFQRQLSTWSLVKFEEALFFFFLEKNTLYKKAWRIAFNKQLDAPLMHHLEDFLNLGDRVEESGTSRLSGFCNFVSLARRIVEREVVSGGFRFFYLHGSLPCLFAGFYFVRLIHLGRRVYSCNTGK